MDTCKGCERRQIGCHGKQEDGTWRCEAWGREQDAKAAGHASARFERDAENYVADQRVARERRRKSHHMT